MELQLQKKKEIQNIRPKNLYQYLFIKALKNITNGILYIFLNEQEYIKIGKENYKIPAYIYVKDENFFKYCILFGEIGFAEAFILGYFETPDLYRLLEWFVDNSENNPGSSYSKTKQFFINILGFYNKIIHLFRPNTIKIAKENISKHYDLSNELYKLMLDSTMTYSSGIFSPNLNNLTDAQIEKYERICIKLNLKPGLRVLEIGSGWGGFAKYIAENYDCKVDTITISKEQYEYTKNLINQYQLNDKINVHFLDYRQLSTSVFGKYDRIVSIEMAEALGHKYLDIYFKKIAEMLKDDGIVVLQYINFPESHYKNYLKSVDFIKKHIFPGGELLSHLEVLKSLHRVSELCIYDLESFGISYAKTLKLWKYNFINNIDKIKQLNFDDYFIRKWIYYLTYCEVGFRSRYINVSQVVLSKARNINIIDSTEFKLRKKT
ncbi:MAG: cyclopropane-fatty-acyl-phospholipid synthase family protein [Leptospiraceae bacterium]|nr:cyclopropane-fatty-acyl-phospholipid synthase family protein [Leptospiraceae bacterium]